MEICESENVNARVRARVIRQVFKQLCVNDSRCDAILPTKMNCEYTMFIIVMPDITIDMYEPECNTIDRIART